MCGGLDLQSIAEADLFDQKIVLDHDEFVAKRMCLGLLFRKTGAQQCRDRDQHAVSNFRIHVHHFSH